MPVQPQDLVASLRARHVPGLTRRQLQVLAACELGYTVVEMGDGLGLSTATVRRHLADLQARIFACMELCPTHRLLAKWTREHIECCAGPIGPLIENSQLFDRADQRAAR